MPDLNARLKYVQSWWLASELVRRSPRLVLIETHPGGGQYDCLTLGESANGDLRQLIWINREGSVRVGDQTGFMTFETERSFGDRHGAIRRIEAAAGLQPSSPSPSTSPAALSFRVIYQTLAIMLNGKHQWDARNLRLDTSYDLGTAFDLTPFPTAAEAVREPRRNDVLGEPAYRFWGLGAMSGVHTSLEVKAVLDTDGVVHLPSGKVRLPELYSKHKRRLTATVAAALGTVLP